MAGGGVGEHSPGLGQLAPAVDPPVELDGPTKGSQLGDQSLHDPLAAAFDDRPTVGVAKGDEQQAVRARQRFAQREHRVRRRAREEPFRLLAVEPSGETGDRQEAREPEARHRERVPGGGPQGAKESGEHLVDVPHQRPEKAAVRCAVLAQAGRGLVHRRHDRTGAPPVERVGEGHFGREQLDAPGRQVHAAKERRRRHQGVDRRANVMVKTRERQLGRAAPSAG